MPTSSIQTAAQVRDLFDQIAPHYDVLNQVLSLGLHQVWKGMAVGWLDPPVGGQGLDICCGSGDLAFQMARRVGRQGRVIGLDFSAQLLQIAARRGSLSYPGHTLQWVQGDALALPFEDQQFDGVTMGYGLRNVTDIPQALSEIYRVLKPGGRAAILDFQIPPDPWLQSFQEVYLDRVVVPFAAQRGLREEYAYIMASLTTFPSGIQQCELATKAGFSSSHFRPLMAGMMGLVIASR